MQMTGSKTEDSLYEVRDGIAFLTFNRPQSYNALTFEMYDRLADVCAIANADRSIRAMVLAGAGGKAFAAGTDIAQFRSFRGPDDALAYEARIERVLAALEECRVPTLAAIAGACTGGGLGIAACCDIRISADNARFGMPIARTLGNCLSLSNYARFADLLGTARLKEMIFTARTHHCAGGQRHRSRERNRRRARASARTCGGIGPNHREPRSPHSAGVETRSAAAAPRRAAERGE